MAYNDGIRYSGTISQQATSTAYIRKEEEFRRKLYEQIPHEDMKMFPFTKLVMTKKGDPIKNHKHSWYLQTIIKDFGTATISSVDTNNKTISLNKANFCSGIKPRKYETYEIVVKNANDVITHHLFWEFISESGNTYVGALQVDDDGVIIGQYPSPWSNGLANGTTVYLNRSYIAQPEGSGLPEGEFVQPIEFYNYSQIVMEAFSVTGSELADVDIFTESKYNRYLKQAMQRFNRQIEEIIRYGVRRRTTGTMFDGSTGQRTLCGGLLYFMEKYYPENIIDITQLGASDKLNYNFTGLSWNEGAYDFIKCLLTYLGKTSNRRKTLIGSVDVIKSINDVLESITNVQIDTKVKNEWGFEVTRITSTLCDLDLLIDYQSSMNPGRTNIVWIITPDMIEYRPRINRDITIIKSEKDLQDRVENGFTWRDAVKEGIVVDFSLEVNYLDGACIIYNWGKNFKSS